MHSLMTVGAGGRVIGLDFNDAMLGLARKYECEMERKLGWRNFSFHKARIQDMALDLAAADQWLREHPVSSAEQLREFEAYCERLRKERPLILDNSIDVVVSNCVLNLVKPEEKRRLFAEMFRVLRKGGRAVVSDIVCDEEPGEAIRNDPDLWSGCIAGAFREDDFLDMFEEAGFHGIEILSREGDPWQTINGIEFRSMTLRAYKGKHGPCIDRCQAVVYRGPWKQVRDDDGHVYHRGRRMAVCDKTYKLLTDPAGPYAREVAGIEPREEIPLEHARPFDCRAGAERHPRQTKGEDYCATEPGNGSVCTGGACC